MNRRRVGNVIKGLAWLFLAAAALPSFSTSSEPSGDVTRLAVGLPWSPWLVYQESWSRPQSSLTGMPSLTYETALEPRSGSAAAMLISIALFVVSRFFSKPVKNAARPAAAPTRRPTSVLGA
jgi:hypothetical protein